MLLGGLGGFTRRASRPQGLAVYRVLVESFWIVTRPLALNPKS